VLTPTTIAMISVVVTAAVAAAAVPVALSRKDNGAWNLGLATRLGLGLAIWLIVTSTLAVAHAYEPRNAPPVPPTAIALAAAIAGSALAIRRIPDLRDAISAPGNQPALVLLQLWRLDGLAVLVLWSQGELPAVFALPAGIGDALVALTAPYVAVNIQRRRLLIGWNLAGFLVLVGSVGLAIATSPGTHLITTMPTSVILTRFPFALIPTFFVTLSNACHLASLRYALTARS
jgi:hypothetical protein